MKTITKNKVLIALISTLVMVLLMFGFTMDFTAKAYAAEIDYVNQDYQNIPAGFNEATEDVIYKIHCPNVRQMLGITEDEDGVLEDYITSISFRASMGCQIYFVEGVACNREDIYSGDYAWNMYSNYYEILHYDDTNKNVYLKFKNLSQLDADESVSANLEDLGILYSSNSYVNPPQYIYLSNIEQPVTEVTPEDVYFSTDVVAAHGGRGFTDYNIYSVEYTIKLNQKVSHLVSDINVSFLKGGEKFTLYKSAYTTSDGQGDENGYINFAVITLGDISDITERIKLQAVITYTGGSITIESKETDLISLWTNLVNDGYSAYDYDMYMTEDNKTHITKLVESYNSGFFAEIKGSQNYFADYDKNTDIKLTSLIFKIPLTSFNYASFGWSTSYWQGYCYFVSVRIDSDLMLTTTAYKMATNENGTVTVGVGDIEYNDSVAATIYDSVDYFAYNDALYIRIKDDSPISTYFPQKATRSFGASATNTSYQSITLQANTATIIYDDYNKELLAEIESLKTQLTEIQSLLESANALSESQRELINTLKSSLDGLRVDYDNAQDEIAYMTEQIEVMREEYQKKIDQLIAENGNNNTDTPPSAEEPTDNEEDGMKLEQIIGLSAGLVILVIIIALLIPKRRRR